MRNMSTAGWSIYAVKAARRLTAVSRLRSEDLDGETGAEAPEVAPEKERFRSRPAEPFDRHCRSVNPDRNQEATHAA